MRSLPSYATLILLALSPIWAESQLEPPELERYLRWGPVRARPGLRVTNVGYDDNILLRTEAQKIGDYTATLSPRLDGLVLFGHRAFLTFRQRLDYTAYVDNTDQNFLDNRTAGRLTLPLRQLGLYADLELNRLKERPLDLDDVRPERRERGVEIGVILEPGWRTEIELARRFKDYTYDDPDFDPLVLCPARPEECPSISDRLDRTTRGTTLRVAYRAFGRTRVLFDGLRQAVEFDVPASLDDGQEVARDTRETRLLAGLEFGQGGPLTGVLRVGWGRIDAVDPALTDWSKLIGDAELVYRLNSRTRFELEGDRTPGFSVSGLNSYYLRTELGLRSVYYFSRLVGTEAGASLGRITFPDSTNAAGRRDRLRRYEVGVRLRLAQDAAGRRVEYSLRLGRYRRDSTVDGLDRSQTTVGLGAVLGF